MYENKSWCMFIIICLWRMKHANMIRCGKHIFGVSMNHRIKEIFIDEADKIWISKRAVFFYSITTPIDFWASINGIYFSFIASFRITANEIFIVYFFIRKIYRNAIITIKCTCCSKARWIIFFLNSNSWDTPINKHIL